MSGAITKTELFPRNVFTLQDVKDRQQFELDNGAISSEIDATSDPANFILTTKRAIIDDAADAAQPGTARASGPTTVAAAAQPGASPSNAILADFHGNGASAATAAQDHLGPGVDASRKMAQTDLPRVTPLKDRFNAAAALTGLPPALLAAIASRESRCGNVLAQDGTGDGGMAFGIMQVDKRSHAWEGLPDPRSQAHINQAAGILKASLTTMIGRFANAPPARQLQAAVAAYNCGAGAVATPDTADAHTTGHDYSNDVWERARFYATGW